MGVEIERKFLVRSDAWRAAADPGSHYVQAYLCADPDRTVRVRLAGEAAWLTLKGRGTGVARPEFEYAIPAADARALLALCLPGRVEKIRYRVPVGRHVFEVDVFAGDHAGLVLAEVELGAEDEHFDRPAWLGKEVTRDRRYANSALAATPGVPI
ncbi:MAG: CYTH domain-containing protein [bacterium]